MFPFFPLYILAKNRHMRMMFIKDTALGGGKIQVSLLCINKKVKCGVIEITKQGDKHMSDDFKTSYNTDNPEQQGTVLRGILGGIAGMFVCVLALLICSLFQISTSVLFQLFVGLVIGWFYRLFHGQRSKTAAYITVGICTVLTCTLWVVLLALLSVVVSNAPFTAADLGGLWSRIWELLLLCVGLGLIGFFFTRRNLLAYADWKRSPWLIAYAGGNGALYNLLPEKLPATNPPTSFAVHSRFASGTRIVVEGSSVRLISRLRKDRVFSVHDIVGVVLGPGNGCNVLYDKNYQVLAKFAGSMEHADLLLLWLLQWNIPIDKAPAGWHSPVESSPDTETKESSVLKQQFKLRLKRSTQIGFSGIGWFLLLIGAALFMALNFSSATIVERRVVVVVVLAVMGMGIVYLRIGKVCQVEVDGEQMRVVSRLGRAAEFSVREVSSVSRSLGWIVLYDREFRTLAKIDSYLENLDMLKEYLDFYGIKW